MVSSEAVCWSTGSPSAELRDDCVHDLVLASTPTIAQSISAADGAAGTFTRDMLMTTTERDDLTPRVRASQVASTLAAFGGGLLAIATIIGFSLHLAGHVANTTYLTSLGLEADLFPQSSEGKIIGGYYALVWQGVGLITDFPWRSVIVLFLLLLLMMLFVRLPDQSPRAQRWLRTKPKWMKELVFALTGSTLSFALVGGAACFMMLIALFPAVIGQAAGQQHAEKTRELIRKMTPASASEIWLGDARKHRGIVVASSPELLAIFDIDTKRMHTIDRRNTELRQNYLQSTSIRP